MTCKIIIIADWIIQYITKEPYMFAKHLHTHYGWTIIKLSMLNIEQLKQRQSIVLCITYDSLNISILKCENITLIYKIDDLYPYKDIRKTCIDYADLLISPYQYLFKEENIIQMYPSIKSKDSYHISYSAVESFYINIGFNNTPKEKIFVSGTIISEYPLRNYILKYKEYIEILEHPTYNNYKHNIIDEKYYNKLSEYLCCFTDSSKYKYVLLKVFEICSVGSLLLCDELIQDELYNLGFENNINYISCNKENLESKMKWILDKNNREIVDEIRLKGMNLVKNNHNTNNRSESFNSLINNKYFTDIEVCNNN